MRLEPHHVGLIVSDLDRSTAFYEALGFEVVSTSVTDGGALTLRFIRLGDLQIELFKYAEEMPPCSATRHVGLRHVALRTDDMDSAVAELGKRGLMPDDVVVTDIPHGPRLLFFPDPDGVEIEIIQPAGA